MNHPLFWLYEQVKINEQKIRRGFLQGGITSQDSISNANNKLFKKQNNSLKKKIYNSTIQPLRTTQRQQLKICIDNAKEIIQTFLLVMQDYGLIINENKTEYMIIKSKISEKYRQTQTKMNSIMQQAKVNSQLTQQFKYLGLWIEDNGNIKSNQEAILNKMKKYQNFLRKISFISNNTTLIINAWTTFIRTQFQYGLTTIKDSTFKGTWNSFRKNYYKSLAKCIGLFRITNGDIIAQTLKRANVETVEKQYRLHLLKQIKQLTQKQKIFYDLQEKENQWKLEFTKPKKITYQIQKKIKYEVTEAEERHITKQMLNYEGSLQNQKLQLKRYYDDLTKNWISAYQLIKRKNLKEKHNKSYLQQITGISNRNFQDFLMMKFNKNKLVQTKNHTNI